MRKTERTDVRVGQVQDKTTRIRTLGKNASSPQKKDMASGLAATVEDNNME